MLNEANNTEAGAAILEKNEIKNTNILYIYIYFLLFLAFILLYMGFWIILPWNGAICSNTRFGFQHLLTYCITVCQKMPKGKTRAIPNNNIPFKGKIKQKLIE